MACAKPRAARAQAVRHLRPAFAAARLRITQFTILANLILRGATPVTALAEALGAARQLGRGRRRRRVARGRANQIVARRVRRCAFDPAIALEQGEVAGQRGALLDSASGVPVAPQDEWRM